jgi:hypothetical protein
MKFTIATSLLALGAAVVGAVPAARSPADPYNPTSFVPVQMMVKGSTTQGENIFVTGSLPQLTGWSTGGVSPCPNIFFQ